MSLYHCNNCQKSFEHSSGKPRCPDCLRQHGLEAATPSNKQKEKRKRRPTVGARRRLPWALGLSCVVLLTLLALVFVRSRTDLPKPGQLAILDEVVLRQTLIQRGIPSDRLVNPFKPGDAVTALANAKLKEGDSKAKIKQLASAVAAQIKHLKVDLSGNFEHPVRGAEKLAAALKSGEAKRVFDLELAFLFSTILRQHGFAALIAEAHSLEAPVRSAAANGAVGRYLVVVYPKGKLGKTPLITLDPARATALPDWAGGGEDPDMESKADDATSLDDASAVAHLMSLRALQWRRTEKRLPEAYEQVELAVRAASPSATLLMAQALVLATSGGMNDAVSKAQAALALRDDAPRNAGLGEILLGAGKAAEGLSRLENALKKDPAYWPALRSLTSLRWFAREREAGNKLLDQALKIAPNEFEILKAQGLRRLMENNCEAAVRILRRVLAEYAAAQVRLQLYVCLKRLGKDDEAQTERVELLKRAAEDGTTEEIKQALAAIEKGAATSPQPTPDTSSPPLAPPPRRKMPQRLKLPDVNLGSP
jgi:tetratricopeptide (TPR) repeat protein